MSVARSGVGAKGGGRRTGVIIVYVELLFFLRFGVRLLTATTCWMNGSLRFVAMRALAQTVCFRFLQWASFE